MNFEESKAFYLLFLLPFAAWLGCVGIRRVKGRLALILPLSQHVQGWSRAEFLPLFLRLTALVLIILAMARPRWDFQWKEVRRRGTDMVIALDVSRSMNATDLSPSRLHRAKWLVKDILASAQGDRVGLVLFSGAAFVQCPLTVDRTSLELFLDAAESDTIPVQGTAILEALVKAERALQDGEETGAQGKAILLISDGEDHQGELEGIADELAKKQIRVHSIGMAGSGAPVPLPEGGFVRDASGSLVLTRLDERPLRMLAEKTGGRYRRFIGAGQDFGQIYRDEIRAQIRPEDSVSREKVWQERHVYISALAGMLLVFDYVLIRWYRRRALLTK